MYSGIKEMAADAVNHGPKSVGGPLIALCRGHSDFTNGNLEAGS